VFDRFQCTPLLNGHTCGTLLVISAQAGMRLLLVVLSTKLLVNYK
jgi:hypothetical protein